VTVSNLMQASMASELSFVQFPYSHDQTLSLRAIELGHTDLTGAGDIFCGLACHWPEWAECTNPEFSITSDICVQTVDRIGTLH